jgi:hypothetical protein
MTEHYIENEAYGAVVNAIATITHLAPDESRSRWASMGTSGHCVFNPPRCR